MNNEFVYKQVLDQSKLAGVSESIARNQAEEALDNYKKNRFKGKVFALIKSHVDKAKRLSK